MDRRRPIAAPALLGAIAALALALPAWAAPAATALASLKWPGGIRLSPLFAANALGQASLNGQVNGPPEALLALVRTGLELQGYRERAINTVVGPWGFNLVMDPPASTTVDGVPAGKQPALILQSTALGPGKLNLNVRYEGL